MKMTIITRDGRQDIEFTGKPVIVIVDDDKKYLLTEKGSFKRIYSKDKCGIVEILNEWK